MIKIAGITGLIGCTGATKSVFYCGSKTGPCSSHLDTDVREKLVSCSDLDSPKSGNPIVFRYPDIHSISHNGKEVNFKQNTKAVVSDIKNKLEEANKAANTNGQPVSLSTHSKDTTNALINSIKKHPECKHVILTEMSLYSEDKIKNHGNNIKVIRVVSPPRNNVQKAIQDFELKEHEFCDRQEIIALHTEATNLRLLHAINEAIKTAESSDEPVIIHIVSGVIHSMNEKIRDVSNCDAALAETYIEVRKNIDQMATMYSKIKTVLSTMCPKRKSLPPQLSKRLF